MTRPSPTALIDRVDDNNHVVGQVERGQVLRLAANFRTVHVLVFTTNGSLILQRIGHEGTRHPGLLGSSMAGYLFATESYEDAARRRIAEELGIEPVLTPLGVTNMRDQRSTKFIGVFTAISDDARIASPGHIDALEVWDLSDLRAALTRRPSEFTDSFRHVMTFFDEVDGTLPS